MTPISPPLEKPNALGTLFDTDEAQIEDAISQAVYFVEDRRPITLGPKLVGCQHHRVVQKFLEEIIEWGKKDDVGIKVEHRVAVRLFEDLECCGRFDCRRQLNDLVLEEPPSLSPDLHLRRETQGPERLVLNGHSKVIVNIVCDQPMETGAGAMLSD